MIIALASADLSYLKNMANLKRLRAHFFAMNLNKR